MKRIAEALSKLNQAKRAWAVFVLCATTAIALPAQTFHQAPQLRWYGRSGPPKGGANPDDRWGPLRDHGKIRRGQPNIGHDLQDRPGRYADDALQLLLAKRLRYCSDGANPSLATLLQNADGDFYGTTYGGRGRGLRTVFKITPSGTLTTLYSFCSQVTCTDGKPTRNLGSSKPTMEISTDNPGRDARDRRHGLQDHSEWHAYNAIPLLHPKRLPGRLRPLPGLVQTADGDLYGTAGGGGANDYDAGTVFKITPSGTLTTLYHLLHPKADVSTVKGRSAVLILAANGDFYGTTEQGRGPKPTVSMKGTVFKITPGGALTTLYNWGAQSGCPDGAQPVTCSGPGHQWGLFMGPPKAMASIIKKPADDLRNHFGWRADDAVQL